MTTNHPLDFTRVDASILAFFKSGANRELAKRQAAEDRQQQAARDNAESRK